MNFEKKSLAILCTKPLDLKHSIFTILKIGQKNALLLLLLLLLLLCLLLVLLRLIAAVQLSLLGGGSVSRRENSRVGATAIGHASTAGIVQRTGRQRGRRAGDGAGGRAVGRRLRRLAHGPVGKRGRLGRGDGAGVAVGTSVQIEINQLTLRGGRLRCARTRCGWAWRERARLRLGHTRRHKMRARVGPWRHHVLKGAGPLLTKLRLFHAHRIELIVFQAGDQPLVLFAKIASHQTRLADHHHVGELCRRAVPRSEREHRRRRRRRLIERGRSGRGGDGGRSGLFCLCVCFFFGLVWRRRVGRRLSLSSLGRGRRIFGSV
ncbi:hypothetical protein BpHYR1_029475 [Brachionus plicatilis]|uniref:Uncharacterized protein n=1 Tax=Brachionus plicatilis TaxID=10195 RepID=A0A3M7S2M2_BRAPC|nr:hypothetical protein BpHYR1_029475 [Brachionus plicatilis]